MKPTPSTDPLHRRLSGFAPSEVANHLAEGLDGWMESQAERKPLTSQSWTHMVAAVVVSILMVGTAYAATPTRNYATFNGANVEEAIQTLDRLLK